VPNIFRFTRVFKRFQRGPICTELEALTTYKAYERINVRNTLVSRTNRMGSGRSKRVAEFQAFKCCVFSAESIGNRGHCTVWTLGKSGESFELWRFPSGQSEFLYPGTVVSTNPLLVTSFKY